MASLNLTDAMDLLASGEMESLGLLPWGSNYTFLVKLTDPRYKDEDGDLLICKGAVQNVVAACVTVQDGGARRPLDA